VTPLSIRRSVYVPAAFVLAALLSLCPADAQDAKQQIKKQIDQVEKRIQGGPDSDPNWKESKPNLLKTLAATRESVSAGRTLFALIQLNAVVTDLAGLETIAGSPEIIRGGAPAFEKEWKHADLELAKYGQRYRDGRWDGKPAALRALAEASWVESRALYEASKPYAAATEVQYGLYYLGRSRGNAEYSLFCLGLNLASGKPAPSYRSLAPELEVLQNRVIAAYQPPASIDHHQEFIQLNAAIKTAKELDAAKLYFGSLYKYLDAVRLFALLDAKTPDAQSAGELANEASSQHQDFAAATVDDSIGDIFAERADAALEAFRADNKDLAKLKAARVALETVIPAYLAAVEKPLPAAVPAGHIINVTLVRWPYT
jgi:hypothetical protein